MGTGHVVLGGAAADPAGYAMDCVVHLSVPFAVVGESGRRAFGMSHCSSVGSASGIGGVGSEISGRLAGAGAGERTRASRSGADQDQRDRLEITSRPGLNEDQTLRAELVRRVRGLIEAGRYETPEKIDVATERAVGHINLLA